MMFSSWSGPGRPGSSASSARAARALDEAYNDTYNGKVRAWIAAHGAPPNALKALRGATPIDGAAVARSADGRAAERQGDGLRITGGAFKAPWARPLGIGSAALRVAWGPAGQVLVLVEGPPHEGFGGRVRVQIDPGCACLLQILR